MKWVVLTVLLIVGTATSVESFFSTEYYTISPNFPYELHSKVRNFENAEKMFKAKCLKLTGSDEAYNKAFLAGDVFDACVKSQFNGNEFQKDMENAQLTGNLDSVFRKYCRRTSTVISCTEVFLSAVDPCLETIEKESIKIVLNMIESFDDFLCYKDGQRIVMFIADGGLECIQEKEKAIEGCVNETLRKYITTEVDNLPSLKIEKEECDDFTSLRTCAVAKLKGCPKSTPANFVDALFEIIEKDTNCEKLTSKSVSFNNANIVIKVFMFTIMLFVRYF